MAPWRPNEADAVLDIAGRGVRPHAPAMFRCVRGRSRRFRAAFDRGGELLAAVELRRLFPLITDTEEARECARTIAGWKPLPRAL